MVDGQNTEMRVNSLYFTVKDEASYGKQEKEIQKKSEEGDGEDAKKRVISSYFDKVYDVEASDELRKKKTKKGKEDGQNPRERVVSSYFQKASDADISVDKHGDTKSRTGGAHNAEKRVTSPYFTMNHQVCYENKETKATEKSGEGHGQDAEKAMISPYVNKLNGVEADENESQKRKRKKTKAGEQNPRERVVSPYFQKAADVEISVDIHGDTKSRTGGAHNAEKRVTSPYFTANHQVCHEKKEMKTIEKSREGHSQDAEKAMVSPYAKENQKRKKTKVGEQNPRERVVSPYFRKSGDVEISVDKHGDTKSRTGGAHNAENRVISPYFTTNHQVCYERKAMKTAEKSGEGQDAEKAVVSPYINKQNGVEADEKDSQKSKRKETKVGEQNPRERVVSPYFQKAGDVEISVDKHGDTKSRTGGAHNAEKRVTSPYFTPNHQVCDDKKAMKTTEKSGEGQDAGKAMVSPWINELNGVEVDEKESQKRKRKKTKTGDKNPREWVASPFFEKGNDVETERMRRKKKCRMRSARNTETRVTSPYFTKDEEACHCEKENKESKKTCRNGQDAEKRLACPYFNQVIEVEASDEKDVKGRKKRNEDGQNVEEIVISPLFNNVNDVEASDRKEKRRKDDRLGKTRVISPYFNEINNVKTHDKKEQKARNNRKKDGESMDGENCVEMKKKKESEPLVLQSLQREEMEVKNIELQNYWRAGVPADRTEQIVLSTHESSQQKCCQERGTVPRRNLEAMLAQLECKVNGTRSHLKDRKHQKPESELHDGFTCANIEEGGKNQENEDALLVGGCNTVMEPEDPKSREDCSVFLNFEKSTRQLVEANGRRKQQVRAPKSPRRPHSTVRKVSPYFQKAPEAEELHSSTNCKSCEKKKKELKKNVLSASEKFNEAYRRKRPDNMWKPPRSMYALLQEDHAHDPWRVLVICMLLNVTTGLQVRRVLEDFFTLCPNAKAATETAQEEIQNVIRSLGLYTKRAIMIRRFSQEYLEETWTHVTQLHGVGKYGADAYAIFCTGMWKEVKPEDHMLDYYWRFLCSNDGVQAL